MATSTWQETISDNSKMPVYVSRPDGAGPFPAMVVIQHQGGVDEFVQGITLQLAQDGYVAAAPNLYHRDGPECTDDIVSRRSRLSDRRIINDVDATARFLQSQRFVDGNRLAIIGFCMGGRIVYLAAAANPVFKAAVTYYPSNAFRPWGRDLPSPFERTAEIHCPVQGHFGADDKNPSPEDMNKLGAELTKFDKAHEFYSYPEAAHAFMDSTKDSYRRQAAEAAWERTLDFLRKNLVK
jgi:carboxymethylenebutenolidase